MSVWAWARAFWCQEECRRCQIAPCPLLTPDNIQGSDKWHTPETLTLWQSGIELSSVSGCRQVSGLSGMSRLSSWQQNLEQCAMCNSRVKSTETSEQVDNTSQLIAAIKRLTKAVCLQNLRLHKSFKHCYVCPVPAYTYLTCLPVLLCFLLLRRPPLHSHLLRNDK